MTAEQDGLDLAAIRAKHRDMMRSPKHSICESCVETWPCETYRLTEAVERAREDADEYAPILDRCSQLLRGVADALNGPPPPLMAWSHHDLPEKAREKADQVSAVLALIERSIKPGTHPTLIDIRDLFIALALGADLGPDL